MGLGDNARAALVTRGLAEMMRLGRVLGARETTLIGLAGMGDLVLTCTGDLSRNRRLGLALGAGKSVAIDLGLATPALEDAGDDTCADSVSVALPHLETMSIAFAGDHVDRDQVLAAAQLAHIHEDIEGFPAGYEQELGERGVTLSGGQRQRTAIARALAAQPPVMILDDCLSAVDSVTEQNILRQLRSALADRTAVIVSHRVSALSLADHVIVLDEGRVEEAGSHDELLQRGGLYAELHEIGRASCRERV